MDEMTLTLNSTITEEQWDAITDVDFEHSNEITFHTKHGKEVKFVKASAQPELPKQFMSDDCISRSELYKKVCEAEKLARERVLDTPSDSPFPNKLNPAYTRYSAQLDERTQFKHMIADAQPVQPEITRCKDCIKRDYCRTTNIWAVPPDDDWYCGDAERRTE